jgi:oligopeptide transport system permease protein
VSIGLRPPRRASAGVERRRRREPVVDAWRRLRRNRCAVAAACPAVMALLAARAVAAVLADPPRRTCKLGATPPSAAHWFGTDELGRDRLARVLTAGASRCSSGSWARWCSLLIGVTWGAVAGYAAAARTTS